METGDSRKSLIVSSKGKHGSEQESVRPPCFTGLSVIAAFLVVLLLDAGEDCRQHSWAFRWDLGSLLSRVRRCPAIERLQRRCANVPIFPAPGFPVASMAPLPANKRQPESFQENCLRKKTSSLLRISILRPIREGSDFASACRRNSRRPHDAGVLPVPTASQPRRIRLRRCPMGSNTQVPANWAFLQILAQSPK